MLELKSHEKRLREICKQHMVGRLYLFGSAVSRQFGDKSDIDFLVEFEENKSLFDLIRLKNQLEDLLNKPVDIVTENSVHSTLKEHILNEAIQL